MNHLTPDEIMAAADRTNVNGSLSTASRHLEECPQCRREVEFQRRLMESARKTSRLAVSDRFVERLGARLNLPAEQPALTKYLGNLGNLFGFAMVVGLFGILYETIANFQSKSDAPVQQYSIWSEFVGRWDQVVVWLRSLKLSDPTSALPAVPTDATSFYASVIVAIVGLLLVDRLLSGQIFRHHTARNK